MSDTVSEPKPANTKADEWAERIAAQQRSGISVKQFCKEKGLTEYFFYAWRKRLQGSEPRPLGKRGMRKRKRLSARTTTMISTVRRDLSRNRTNRPTGNGAAANLWRGI